MGSLNVSKEADERLTVIAKESDRNKSAMVAHLIHKEFRNRRNLKAGE